MRETGETIVVRRRDGSGGEVRALLYDGRAGGGRAVRRLLVGLAAVDREADDGLRITDAHTTIRRTPSCWFVRDAERWRTYPPDEFDLTFEEVPEVAPSATARITAAITDAGRRAVEELGRLRSRTHEGTPTPPLVPDEPRITERPSPPRGWALVYDTPAAVDGLQLESELSTLLEQGRTLVGVATATLPSVGPVLRHYLTRTSR